jgi:hypothetical protein
VAKAQGAGAWCASAATTNADCTRRDSSDLSEERRQLRPVIASGRSKSNGAMRALHDAPLLGAALVLHAACRLRVLALLPATWPTTKQIGHL